MEKTQHYQSCDELLSDAVSGSENDDVALLEGYDLTMTLDRRADVNAGTLQIPAGEHETPYLVCEGDASWSDGSQTGVRLTATWDVKDQDWIQWEAVE